MDVADAGKLGGLKRAKVLSKEQLTAIGEKGAKIRWDKHRQRFGTKKRAKHYTTKNGRD